MWCRISLALGLLFPAHGIIFAAPFTTIRPVSLRECLELALAHNLDVQIQHENTELANFTLSSAYGAYSPVFTFDARHDFVSQPGSFDVNKFNPMFPYELNTDTLGPSLSGALPIGLNYDFAIRGMERNARTDFSGNAEDARLYPPDGIRRTNDYYVTATATLRQHLLKDFWIDASREQLLLRRKDIKSSQQAFRFQVMRTVLAVEMAYYDLAAARERIRVQEKALDLRRQLLSETRRRVEVGDLPPLDAEQAETQLQNTLTMLSAAREVYATQQNILKGLLADNFRDWADIELEPADMLLALTADVSRSESFQSAMKNRPDLEEARVAVERNDVIVKFRYNQLFPTLDVVGSYGGIGSEDLAGTAVHQAFSSDNPVYYYGAVLSFPLDNVAERGNYRASKAARKISELQLKKAENDILLQVADFVSRIPSRYDQVTSTRKARSYAEAALSAEQKKLQNGFSTAFVVLQLQETLTAARTAEVQALADYNKILSQLAFADGSILEKRKLTVELK